MRVINVVLLVLAGALAGAVIMKVAQRPLQLAMRPAPPTAASVEVQPTSSEPPSPVAVPTGNDAFQAVSSKPVTPETARPAASGEAARPVEHQRQEPAPSHRISPKPTVAAVPRAPRAVPEHIQFQAARSAAAPPPASSQLPSILPSPPVSPEQPKETPPARVEPENVTPPPAPIPPAPEPNQATLNAGMLIPVRLLDSLSAERNHAGDAFAATLDHELVANGFVVAERGARVEGRVTAVDRGARTMSIALTSVHTSDNQDVPLQTERFEKQSEPDHSQAVTKIGTGAVIGAVVGGIAGGGKGAAIGAGAGGGIGAGDVLLSRRAAALPAETRLSFRLRSPVTITERAQE